MKIPDIEVEKDAVTAKSETAGMDLGPVILFVFVGGGCVLLAIAWAMTASLMSGLSRLMSALPGPGSPSR